MTGLISIFLALTAGLMVTQTRHQLLVILTPFVPVLIFQTWGIGSGRGVSPPSTVDRFPDLIGYYLVQVIIFGVTIGAADQLRRFRLRRAEQNGATIGPDRTGTATMVSLGLSAVVVFFVQADRSFFDPGSVVHHTSQGSPPVVGMLGIGSTVIVFVGLAAFNLVMRLSQRTRTA